MLGMDPLRIFNSDESNFLLARKKGKVLGTVNYSRPPKRMIRKI